MKVSRIIEAKAVTHAYYGWHNELQLTVDGGELKIKLNRKQFKNPFRRWWRTLKRQFLLY